MAVGNAWVMAGRTFNLLERSAAVSVSTSNLATLPAWLYDGRTSLGFQFGGGTIPNANEWVSADGNLVADGNMETFPQAWTVTGTVVKDSSQAHGGTYSAKASGATGVATQDIPVRAGEWLQLNAWGLGDLTGTARIRIQNLQTGNYLQANGTWAAATADLLANATTSWANVTLSFQVEAFSVIAAAGTDLANLRIYCLCLEAAHFAWFDDVYLYPGVDKLVIPSHTVDPIISTQLQSSTTGAFAGEQTVQATLTEMQPGFYASITRAFFRYWRVYFSGTNSSLTGPIRLGEMVIAQGTQLPQAPDFNFKTGYMEDDVEMSSRIGEQWVYNMTVAARRTVSLTFNHKSPSAMAFGRDEIYRRCRGAALPACMILDDQDPTQAIHFRLGKSWDVLRALNTYYTGNILTAIENPFLAPVQ